MDRGGCVDEDPDKFFPDDGNYEYAKGVCATCTVKLICLEYAMQHKIKDGIWGGVTPEQRKKARRRQKLRNDGGV
jgi:WhiB family redox-sensing transcriptional regulator